jgi:uncharacterized protein YdeI (YjbR/CyaY-like superfamily)
MNSMNPTVDGYLPEAQEWREETEKLRMIILDCGLTGELKRGKPRYLFQNNNVVVIQRFQESCALPFCR